MKVAITGHTSGIGKALADVFPEYIGFSRSNGYDINDAVTRRQILTESRDCDIFINNAHSKWAQTELLSLFWNEWKDQQKIIVCIGSNTTEYNQIGGREYTLHKLALEESCKQLRLANKPCKVILIKPAYVDTPRVSDIVAPKIDPVELANCVKSIVMNTELSMWIPYILIYPK